MQNSKFFKFDSDLGADIVNCGSCWLLCDLRWLFGMCSCTQPFGTGQIRTRWIVPVCKGQSASASYGCDVCAIQIRTESSQGATVFVLLAWTPAFIRKERGVLMDNIRGRSRPLAYLPIPIPILINLFSTENKRVPHLHSHVASTVFADKSKYVETISFGRVQFFRKMFFSV